MADTNEPAQKLFQPVQVGNVTVAHRVVLAPLTRYRANAKHVHTDLAVTYYAQRASVPGTLMISEATFIAPYAGLDDHVPGIWNQEQIAAWRKVTSGLPSLWSYNVLTCCTSLSDRRCYTCQGVLHIPPALGSRSCRGD